MIINALFFHIVPTIISRKLSPGIFTSIILFIPLSIYTFYKVSKQYELSAKSLVIAIIGGAIVMMYPILLVKIRSKTS
jgi:ACR3 family arsenite efflux pump ArsB